MSFLFAPSLTPALPMPAAFGAFITSNPLPGTSPKLGTISKGSTPMKMSPRDLERLTRAIGQVCNGSGTTPEQYAMAHPSFSSMRIRWDYFHAACAIDRDLSRDLYANHNDDTIDTALKHIMPVSALNSKG